MELQSSVSSSFPVLRGTIDVSFEFADVLRPPRSKTWSGDMRSTADRRPANVRVGTGEDQVYYMLVVRERAGGTSELKLQELEKKSDIVIV